MTLLIITHVLHKYYDEKLWGYGPYVREINTWEGNFERTVVIAPGIDKAPDSIDLPFKSKHIKLVRVPEFNLMGGKNIVRAFYSIPIILIRMFFAMQKADHIHLRCPGNMGLLGAVVQILFPAKKKTAKYAGNWDWASAQPRSYRIQQQILRNTCLAQNMQVLVYGEWKEKSKNIVPFFTASYYEDQKCMVIKPNINEGINLIFVGTLTSNKRPLLAIQVLDDLLKNGVIARLVMCGEGTEKEKLLKYVKDHKISAYVEFRGNVSAKRLITEYSNSHFLIFGSISEGWPKVVAEAMWWGCVPITTGVSCVPQMLGNGTRGVLSDPSSKAMSAHVIDLYTNPKKMDTLVCLGKKWARQYTIERFERSIRKFV